MVNAGNYMAVFAVSFVPEFILGVVVVVQEQQFQKPNAGENFRNWESREEELEKLYFECSFGKDISERKGS